MLIDCTTASSSSCSLEPVPGESLHQSSRSDQNKIRGTLTSDHVSSDHDSGDNYSRVNSVNSEQSEPNHGEGAADSPDTDNTVLDSGTFSEDERTNLIPINCERAKYIEVIHNLRVDNQ